MNKTVFLELCKYIMDEAYIKEGESFTARMLDDGTAFFSHGNYGLLVRPDGTSRFSEEVTLDES